MPLESSCRSRTRARARPCRSRSRGSPPAGTGAEEQPCAKPWSCGSSIAGALLTPGGPLAEDGQRPPGPAGVVDEGVFEVEARDVPAERRERFDDPALVVAEVEDDQLEPVADLPRLDEPRAAGERRRPARELEHHPADALLEVIRGAVDAQHAVDQDADPVGDPLDVGEDVRAEED